MKLGGRGRGSISAGEHQSWRDLARGPGKGPRVESASARRRRYLRWGKRLALLLLAVILLGALGTWLWVLAQRAEPIEVATPSKPVEQIIFDTDGVLPDRWLGSVIELRRDTTLMEVDIHALKAQLEAEGQVRSATVEREFPSSLRIRVREHEPVLRMRVMGPGDRPEIRIVSREGTVYEGVGYPEAALRKLPFLQPYRPPGGGVLPIRGMDRVAELLEVSRRTQPEFFRTWQLVSLAHFSGDADMPGEVIEVRTTLYPRVIFGTNLGFAQQLDRLAVILDYVRRRGNPAIKRIDLSPTDSAAVQFESGRISTF